jgi:Fe-S-cluster containining protein
MILNLDVVRIMHKSFPKELNEHKNKTYYKTALKSIFKFIFTGYYFRSLVTYIVTRCMFINFEIFQSKDNCHCDKIKPIMCLNSIIIIVLDRKMDIFEIINTSIFFSIFNSGDTLLNYFKLKFSALSSLLLNFIEFVTFD